MCRGVSGVEGVGKRDFEFGIAPRDKAKRLKKPVFYSERAVIYVKTLDKINV